MMNLSQLAIEDKCICPAENCDKEFKSSSQLNMHILRHHDGCKLPVKVGQKNEYFCPINGCPRAQGNKPFPRLGQLKQHYHSVHSVKYSCERCGRRFGLKDVYNRHRNECGTLIQCLTCKETFCTRNALYQHAKRKNHQLPPGSKPRIKNRSKKKTSPIAGASGITLFPIVVRQVVKLSSGVSKEAASQTEPQSAPITTASQSGDCSDASTQQVNITLKSIGEDHSRLINAGTEHIGGDIIQLGDDRARQVGHGSIHFVDASTQDNTGYVDLSTELVDSNCTQFVDASTQFAHIPSPDPISQVLDASTNTVFDYPVLDSSFDQLIDASTNTLPLHWVDLTSKDLVDTGTSTLPDAFHGVCVGDVVDLATQTNFDELATLVSTQTELPQINTKSHDTTDHTLPHSLQERSYDTHDFCYEAGFKSMDFSMHAKSHSQTRNISTSTNISTSEFSVQTNLALELDTISPLLSGYVQDFGTQTVDSSNLTNTENMPQFCDFSTQTHSATDSFTQTSILSHSGTQTLLDYDLLNDFSTQT